MTSTFSVRLAFTALVASLGLSILSNNVTNAAPLNGVSENGTDQYGYYYAISGGQFPTGNIPNGDNGSGGTFRFLVDDAAEWSRPASQSGVWQKDDWFTDTASMALTLRNGGAIVYDNNGLEPDAAIAADPAYYDYYLGNYPDGGHGAHTMYSMSNNFDWIYAGYFNLESDTTIESLTGYFNYSSDPSDGLTLGFDPNDPAVSFRMNIWSNVDGDLLPTDTGSFDGDVFTSDSVDGTFDFSDTGFNRAGTTTLNDIYRLTYTLDEPLTLSAGVYWFSHDVELSTVPEPSTIALAGIAGLAGVAIVRRRRNR